MSKAEFERRTKALEVRHQADQGGDEAAKARAFLEKLTYEELERGLAIAERTHDYTLPLTPEELKFLDSLEAKYRTD